METDGLRANEECGGDLTVGATIRQKAQHLPLAPGQPEPPRQDP